MDRASRAARAVLVQRISVTPFQNRTFQHYRHSRRHYRPLLQCRIVTSHRRPRAFPVSAALPNHPTAGFDNANSFLSLSLSTPFIFFSFSSNLRYLDKFSNVTFPCFGLSFSVFSIPGRKLFLEFSRSEEHTSELQS